MTPGQARVAGDSHARRSCDAQACRRSQDYPVPAWLILYAGFGHPITKPKSSRAVRQANLDGFSHRLWDEPIPKDLPLLGSSGMEAGK
jgi:hypothetical protein